MKYNYKLIKDNDEYILISKTTNKEVSIKNGNYRIYKDGKEIYEIKKSNIYNEYKNNTKDIQSVIHYFIIEKALKILNKKLSNKLIKFDFQYINHCTRYLRLNLILNIRDEEIEKRILIKKDHGYDKEILEHETTNLENYLKMIIL